MNDKVKIYCWFVSLVCLGWFLFLIYCMVMEPEKPRASFFYNEGSIVGCTIRGSHIYFPQGTLDQTCEALDDLMMGLDRKDYFMDRSGNLFIPTWPLEDARLSLTVKRGAATIRGTYLLEATKLLPKQVNNPAAVTLYNPAAVTLYNPPTKP